MNFVKKMYGVNITVSVILLIFGLILFIKPETTITVMSMIIGIILLLMGITSLTRYFKDKYRVDLIYGVVTIIAGLILILNPSTVVSILPFILGMYFIISGITKLKYSLDVRYYNNKSFISLLIVAILTTICGVVLVINPFSGAVAITKIIGAFLTVYSILDIINYITIRKDSKMVEVIFKNEK